jgi:gliding motility-associated-like protein
VKLKLGILYIFVFQFIIVKANPVADFTVSKNQGCLPLTVAFSDKSTGTGLSYLWDFGNGNRSVLQNPSAIYYQSGNFKVTLTVTDANGQKSTKTFNPIRVFKNPTANFSSDTLGCIGDILNFKDLSIDADTVINKWTWDFGDGQLTSSQNPTHAYTYSNTFTIGLTIVDGFGCKNLITKQKHIRIKPTPKASFKMDKTYSCQLPGVFKATNTSTGGGTYSWLCSDGKIATSTDYTTNITSFGNYNLKLTATNAGCSSTFEFKPLVVEKLTARFGPETGPVCSGAVFLFQNASTPNNNGITYEWDFGDGESSTEKQPSHEYSTPGNYTLKLKAKFGSCEDEITKQIVVKPAPNVSISVLDSIGCEAPFVADFNIYGYDYIRSYWTFGDESAMDIMFNQGEKIKHNYSEAGSYPVKAKIMNSYGCVQNINLEEKISVGEQSVEINPKSVAECLPKEQKFTLIENLKEPVLKYTWTFGDSSSNKYNTKSVNKLFTTPGKYKVTVTVETIYGCILEDDAEVQVGNKYKPKFEITQRDICGRKDTVFFKNTSDDSIKLNKDIRFSLMVFDTATDLSDTTNSKFVKSNILKTYRGGWHRIKIVATHFGCNTESDEYDSVYSHGPYISLKVRTLNCRNDKVVIEPTYSWGNRYELKDNKNRILPYDSDTPLIANYIDEIYTFKAWNDTFNCEEKEITPEGLPYKVHNPGLYHLLNQECAPAKVTLNHNGTMKWFKWLMPNGDTSFAKSISMDLKNKGAYQFKLLGYYDSTYCIDTINRNIVINGVELKSKIVSSGICMPIQLSLYDSTAGTDDNLHIWSINGDNKIVNSLKTDYTVNSLFSGDSMIRIIHKVQAPNGCMSEKEYNLPYSGPTATYKIQRFTICDTPVFYFKTFVDSSRTKFPVTYEWTMSDGSKNTNANFNSKYKTMGMNYFTLSITDKFGCKTNFYDSFEVSPNMLQPKFTADPIGRFCPPLKCNFFDQSKTFVSEIIRWEWDFGDGTTSELRNPEKLYLLPGNYDITLKVTSKSGCSAILKKPGYIIVNGPRGKYDFDRGNACLPHTVQFRGITYDSASMEWDLGDGVVKQGNYFKHTYNLPGKYIPAMILSDTLGCKYTLPPIDTIEVFDYPKAELLVSGLCLKQPISIKQKSVSNHQNPSLNYSWFFNGKVKDPGKDSLYMPESRGVQSVRLIVENIGTCKDTVDYNIRIFAPKADFVMKDKFVCLGLPVSFLNQSQSDTTVKSFEWDLGDGNQMSGSKIQHIYNRPGAYDVRLIAKDVLNCYDTIVKPKIAVVGDTVAPPVVPIRRANVLNNRQVELVYSKFPSFDFNSYSIYRLNNGVYNKMATINNAEDTVFIDKQCQTLDNSYCYKVKTQNLCLLNSDLNLSREHCTIETKADGLLEANFVKWSPYIGFDSIAFYRIYRSDVETPLDFVFLDSVKSTQLTYIDSSIQCHTRQNYKIKAIQHSGFREFSFSDTASAQPYFINQTLPNEVWRTTVENNEYTRLEWMNNAYSKRGIKGYLVDKYFADGNKLFGNKYFNAQDTVFEDKQVNVNKYSYIYSMRAIDNCLDTTPWSNPAQSILLKGSFDVASNKPKVMWNHYQLWKQGIDKYEIERKLPSGEFVLVGTVNANTNSFIDESAELTCSPNYIYRVKAYSNLHNGMKDIAISISNETEVQPYSTLFVPNAFSPNNNGINEKFNPNGQYITNYNIKIFNRWGELLFESSECLAPWDGKFKGEICQQDAYMYIIEAKGSDNKLYNLHGTFHLLR